MSTASEESESEISLPEEEYEKINIGLYIGGRNSKGERNGRGWAILPNGDQYDGQYQQGRRHGIGLYVFQDGSRYFGQYRCGHRSGRGIFIYPDGSHYEGFWRKNFKHGKGRYYYSNGDSYCGSWYRGQRHGVGIYTRGSMNDNTTLSFKGTWRQGIRVGPFEFTFGTDEKCSILHGMWDNLYSQGPCVFSFVNRYMLTGFFQIPGHETNKHLVTEDLDYAEENENQPKHWVDKPSFWVAQDICNYDYSLLPQEPVPLPISDSDISVCSLSTTTVGMSNENPISYMAEAEEDDGDVEMEQVPCDVECSTSEIEKSSMVYPLSSGDPCDIEILKQE